MHLSNDSHRFSTRQLKPWAALIVGILLVSSLQFGGSRPAQAATDVGYRDFSFRGAGAPTADKPQSKLWFNDGLWWGALFNRTTKKFDIYRFNWSPNTWSDTGTVIDERTTVRTDCLWDGTHLYIASAVRPGTTT